jgi:hypothetical protein
MWDLWWTKCRWGRSSLSTSVSPANIYSTNFSPQSPSPIIRGWYNRPVVAAVPEVPPQKLKKKTKKLPYRLPSKITILKLYLNSSQFTSWRPLFHGRLQGNLRCPMLDILFFYSSYTVVVRIIMIIIITSNAVTEFNAKLIGTLYKNDRSEVHT